MNEDLYEILGVSPDATADEIRSAHRRLAKKYHPDKGKGGSSDRFRSVQHAYDVLSDPAAREAYDRRCRPVFEIFVSRGPSPVRHSRVRHMAEEDPSHLDLRHLGRSPGPEGTYRRRESSLRRSDFDPFAELLELLLRF